MIEEPPLLTIKTPVNRPTEAQIAAFKDRPTGFLCDAMGGHGALAPEIKSVAPGKLPPRLCGPALTVDCGPSDILALLAALAEVKPGDVVVVSVGGWRDCAAVGDRVMGMLKNSGAAGLVTDGPARDVAGIVDVGLPLYCSGVTPNSPFSKGPGKIGLPVSLCGRRISSGDLVVADEDGVVTVPFEEIDRVAEAVNHVAALEEALDAEVAEGRKVPDAIVELLASDQVKRI